MDFAEVFKRQDQRVGSAPAVSERLDGLVELMYQCETREYKPHAFRLFQGHTHVLDEMLDKESWFEVAL